MKIKKLLGIAVTSLTLSMGVIAGVKLSSKEKAQEVSAVAASNITVGAQRINILVPTDSWVFNNDAMIFSSRISDDYQNFDFIADTDIGTTSINGTARDFNSEYWIATKELPADFTTSDWNVPIERHSGADYWNKVFCECGMVWTSRSNTFIYTGDALTYNSFYYKVALHTGLNHENISYQIINRNTTPADPEAIPGYTFAGWYTNPECTQRLIDVLTGDANLYAKYTKNDYVVRKYAIVDEISSNPILLEEINVARGDMYEYPEKLFYPEHSFIDYWYTDPTLDNVFTSVSDVESDINIYGNYSSTPFETFTYEVDLNNSGWALGSANYAIRFETPNSYSPVDYCWSEYLTNVPANQPLLEIECSDFLDIRNNYVNAVLIRYNINKTKSEWEADKDTGIWNKTESFSASLAFPDLRVGDTVDEHGDTHVYSGAPFVMGEEPGGEWDRLSFVDVYKVNGAGHVEAYNFEVELTSGTEFKMFVAPYDDQYDYYSNFTNHALLNGVFTGGYGNNIVVHESGTYAFFFDTTTHNLHITKEEYIYADEWAASFLEEVTCSGTGSITKDGWSTVKVTYASLDANAKAVFEQIPTHGNQDGCDIEKTIAIYDNILIKYGIGETLPKHPDFMSRFSKGGINENIPTAGANNLILGFTNGTTPIAFVVIVSVVSLTTIGGIFYFKKRKEQ